MATSIITKTARVNMVKGRAGLISLPTIVGMAFGDGGVDSSGNPTDVSENATTLNNELFRAPYDSKEMVADTVCRYTYTMGATVLPNKKISEIGLYDSAGNIVSIKHFMAKGKDADLEITFQVDDEF